MQNNTRNLYEAIFKRKSVRKYLPDTLPSDQLEDIVAFTNDLKPLIQGISTEIELINGVDVKGIVAKAPHYLRIYSQKKEGYLLNVGFMMQQVDLYLSSLGLGSCWLGMAKTTEPAKNGMAYVIMLAFGNAKENPHREEVTRFKRRDITEIAAGHEDRLEAVRLAPSAGNSQPWYFTVDGDCIYVYRKKLGFIKLYETMNQIDMGIGLCHLWLASEQENRSFAYNLDLQNEPKVNGYDCIGRVL